MIIETNSKQLEMEELLSPFVQVFNEDEYHLPDEDLSFVDSELGSDVRKIRRRYSDLLELREAQFLYDDYMEKLIDSYGGKKFFKMMLDGGRVKEYIPPVPRMKSSKRNRMLIKHDMFVPNRIKAPDDILDRVKFMADNYEFYAIRDASKGKKIPKKRKKIYEEALKDLETKHVCAMSQMDYLEYYFTSKQKMEEAEEEDKNKPTLTDYFTDNVIYGDDEPDENEIRFYKGQYLAVKDIETLEFYDDMEKFGWDAYKLLQAESAKARSAGVYDKRTGKRLTKMVKDARKEKKKAKKRKKNPLTKQMDEFLVRIGASNGYDSFEEYEEDMRNFTHNSVFGG